jgi:hypothetical protein
MDRRGFGLPSSCIGRPRTGHWIRRLSWSSSGHFGMPRDWTLWNPLRCRHGLCPGAPTLQLPLPSHGTWPPRWSGQGWSRPSPWITILRQCRQKLLPPSSVRCGTGRGNGIRGTFPGSQALGNRVQLENRRGKYYFVHSALRLKTHP